MYIKVCQYIIQCFKVTFVVIQVRLTLLTLLQSLKFTNLLTFFVFTRGDTVLSDKTKQRYLCDAANLQNNNASFVSKSHYTIYYFSCIIISNESNELDTKNAKVVQPKQFGSAERAT